jgi:hypothetical protein
MFFIILFSLLDIKKLLNCEQGLKWCFSEIMISVWASCSQTLDYREVNDGVSLSLSHFVNVGKKIFVPF